MNGMNQEEVMRVIAGFRNGNAESFDSHEIEFLPSLWLSFGKVMRICC